MKKAVKKNPDYKSGEEVKWFKVLITDNKTKKDKVRITLPISLFEILLKSHKDMKIDHDECEVDLDELFKELKKIGRMMLIEIYEEDETVKVWLE